MDLIVQKFGGTSVGDLSRIEIVADHIKATTAGGKKVVVTVSAMGTQTDELMSMALQLHEKPPQRELDMLLTTGERVSMALLSIALSKRGIESQSLTGSQSGILTDEVHGNARVKKVLGDRIREGLERGRVVIVAGFQGVSPITKEITTLGRGGTDLSAVALATALGASQCELYKDVTGFFTADPRVIKSAKKLSQISYRDASALCWGGAQIVHSRAIHLAAKYKVPIHIRSSFDLEEPGTLITGSTPLESPFVTAITHMAPVKAVRCLSTSGTAVEPIDELWRNGQSPLLSYFDQSNKELRLIVREQVNFPNMTAVQNGLGAITIIGSGFRQGTEILRQIWDCLPVEPNFLDLQDDRIIIILPQENLPGSLEALHQTLLQN